MTDDLAPRDDLSDDAWLLDAALDGELDAARSLAFERRLAAEPALRAQWDARRVLRQAVREQATYHVASPESRERLEAALARADGAPERGATGRGGVLGGPSPLTPEWVSESESASASLSTSASETAADAASSRLRWAGFAASRASRSRASSSSPAVHRASGWTAPRPWALVASGAFAGAAVAVLVMLVVPRPVGSLFPTGQRVASADSMAAEAVSAHTRALLVGEIMEVASSDRHTVRPWLAARLNFVPPIVDFVDQGFPLAGARRDVIGGETSAALVYRHGAHVVSVFVRPTTAPASVQGSAAHASDASPSLEVVRGFNVVQMRAGGMDYTLVSDMSADEMAELARLLMRTAA